MEGKGGQQGECNEREERETEIIVEITYELRAEETGGNEIEGEEEVGGERQSAALSSRLFNYLSCSRTSLLCRARIRQRCDFANYKRVGIGIAEDVFPGERGGIRGSSGKSYGVREAVIKRMDQFGVISLAAGRA